MPVKSGKDSKGSFYRWGSKGAKYYYTASNASSRSRAKSRAERQGRAAHAGGYKG